MSPDPVAAPNGNRERRRLVVGISGASGVILGIRLLEFLKLSAEFETHVIISPAAKTTIASETDWSTKDVEGLADVVYDNRDIGAAPASGSFATMGMVIIPASIKTLSSVANCYDADLITRAADVTLKEGRPLVLVLRETPLHLGHIRLMALVAEAGGVIFPPVPAFYARPQTVDDIVDNTVGRVLFRLGVDNDLFLHWQGLRAAALARPKVPDAERRGRAVAS
jgi:4-hydroxy-3-polyprenylbenzoate decarboxylase